MLNKSLPLTDRVLVTAIVGLMFFLVFFAEVAKAQSPSHSLVNLHRSSRVTHYYVSILAEGESGDYQTTQVDDETEEAEAYPKNARWQGYGVRNEIGVEFLKFVLFNAGYTNTNLRNRNDGSERLHGSRMSFGGKLNFYAPLGNLMVGGGVLSSRLEYQRQAARSTFYGSGYYYSLGYNYFMSTRISVAAEVRQSRETLTRNSGSALVKSIHAKMTGGSLGFNIWL